MKIGTISLNINTHDLNYGAMLHSWAFQRFLLKYENVDTEIINYITPHLYGKNLKYQMWDNLKAGKIVRFILECTRFISHSKRFVKFENFKDNNLLISPIHYSQEKLASDKLDYDVIICESDVIWSLDFFGGDFDPTFFGALPSMKNIKCVAYAASMANGGFSTQQEEKFRELLDNLDEVSCRETYAAEYVQKLYGKDVSCVLDPVLLLNSDEYDIITEPRIIQKPYLLLYLPLGYNLSIIKAAKKYADAKHLKLVELSRYPWDSIDHKTVTDAGIGEFLSLIKNADVIFSNSFHAVCFSVIFQRDFYAFNRRTGKKIEDICHRLKLENRFVDGGFYEQQPIDYNSVHKILNELRAESIEFIERSLNLDDP